MHARCSSHRHPEIAFDYDLNLFFPRLHRAAHSMPKRNYSLGDENCFHLEFPSSTSSVEKIIRASEMKSKKKRRKFNL